MKRTSFLLTAVLGLSLSSGCNKQESTVTPAEAPKGAPSLNETASRTAADLQKNAEKAAADAQKTTERAAADVQQNADKTAADLQKNVDQATTEVKAQSATAQQSADKAVADVKDQTEAAKAQTDASIERVKTLLAENKPAEALQELQKLAAEHLTPEQQARVNDLLKQAQTMVQKSSNKAVDKASQAVGGLLNKK